MECLLLCMNDAKTSLVTSWNTTSPGPLQCRVNGTAAVNIQPVSGTVPPGSSCVPGVLSRPVHARCDSCLHGMQCNHVRPSGHNLIGQIFKKTKHIVRWHAKCLRADVRPLLWPSVYRSGSSLLSERKRVNMSLFPECMIRWTPGPTARWSGMAASGYCILTAGSRGTPGHAAKAMGI